MPPRKSTSSVVPAEPEELSQLSAQVQSAAEKPITATEQQIKARAELGVSIDDYLLPRSLTIRLAKSVLPPNTTIQKDAVLAIQKAATVFVSYLSSHANDATLKRTIAPADVFNALTELELDSFRPRLEKELEAYTEIKAGKRKAKKTDANSSAEVATAAGAGSSATRGEDEDEDVEMLGNPAKRLKREPDGTGAAGLADGDETQEEDVEDEGEPEDEEEEGEGEGEEDDEDEEEEEEEEERGRVDEDVDRVEDLDGQRRGMDPDADETDDDDDDDDGPASQLRDDMGLG